MEWLLKKIKENMESDEILEEIKKEMESGNITPHNNSYDIRQYLNGYRDGIIMTDERGEVKLMDMTDLFENTIKSFAVSLRKAKKNTTRRHLAYISDFKW